MSQLEPLEDPRTCDPELIVPAMPHKRRRRRYKIAWVLTAVLLIVGILPIYTVSSRLIFINKDTLKTQQQVNQMQLASSLAHHIDSFIEGQRRTLAVLAEVLSGEVAGLSGESFLANLSRRRTLSRFVDRDVFLMRYTHRNGTSVTAMQEGFEAVPALEAMLDDDFATHLNTDMGAGTLLGVPFYCEEAAGGAVILSAPVLRKGRRVGVVSALVGLAGLWREAQRSSGYSLFALDGDGTLFSELIDMDRFTGRPYKELELVREFIAVGGSRVMPYPAVNAAGGEVALVGAYYETRLGWGIFMQAEENRAYYMVDRMRRDTWFYAGMAAVGALVMGLAFAGWISRPIRRLADSSVAFAEGDFHARVPINSGNEIGELADTFNVMAETLERYIARLKRAAQENSQLFLGSIRALAAAIDEKDAYTRGHSERVRGYAATLARDMGLPPEEVWKTEVGALLHDVGKIGIQDCILNKPGPLTEEEYEIMKTHPVRGANIMGPIKQLSDVIPIMKHHHERWDGKGYPDGLKDLDIPLSTRLVTIADCWDAMTTNRPYQKAMGMEEGIKRLEVLVGKVFDPDAVKVFIAGMRDGHYGGVYDEAQQQVADTTENLSRIQQDQRVAASARRNVDPDCLPPEPDEPPVTQA
ncbi:MAG: HD domain-containing protein [Acidobacteria bacterium]|nr:HD domain-containing protein [Acidobacteriota bacterium]